MVPEFREWVAAPTEVIREDSGERDICRMGHIPMSRKRGGAPLLRMGSYQLGPLVQCGYWVGIWEKGW